MRYQVDFFTNLGHVENIHTYKEARIVAKDSVDEENMARIVFLDDNDTVISTEIVR